jgi:hypothetical protein
MAIKGQTPQGLPLPFVYEDVRAFGVHHDSYTPAIGRNAGRIIGRRSGK